VRPKPVKDLPTEIITQLLAGPLPLGSGAANERHVTIGNTHLGEFIQEYLRPVEFHFLFGTPEVIVGTFLSLYRHIDEFFDALHLFLLSHPVCVTNIRATI